MAPGGTMTGGAERGLGEWRSVGRGGRGGRRGERESNEREKPGKRRPGPGAGGEPRGGRIGCGRALPRPRLWPAG